MSRKIIIEEHEIGTSQDAAVLCAITVTGVAISEEERVKTSACPLFHSYTHAQTHTFFPPPSLWLSVIYTLLSS